MSEEKHTGFTVVDRRGHAAESDNRAAPSAPAAAPAASASPSTEPAASAPGATGRRERGNMPELDFSTFIMSLASSVLVHLGELAAPGDEAPQVNLGFAKQTIDILGMLADKTRGNLTSDEGKLLEHLLYDLRLKFVEARKRSEK